MLETIDLYHFTGDRESSLVYPASPSTKGTNELKRRPRYDRLRVCWLVGLFVLIIRDRMWATCSICCVANVTDNKQQ